jgi:hypothetical protein
MKDNFECKLSLYLRSERAMLDIFLRDKSRQLFFIGMGFVALFIALIFFDIALFFILKIYFSIHITAFILAGAHALFFLICLGFSKRKKQQKEVEALKDIRDFSKEEVVKDLKNAKNEVLDISHSVKSICRGEFLSLARLIPILRDLLKS